MGRGGGVTPRNLITPTHKLAPAGSEPFSRGETETKTRVDNIFVDPCSSAFFPPDARWNSGRNAVEFSVGVGEYEGVVHVHRRVFEHLLAETPTPDRPWLNKR